MSDGTQFDVTEAENRLIVAAGSVSAVRALTTWIGPDDRIMLASGGEDGTVRRWDATTGSPFGDPLVGDAGTVTTLISWIGPDGPMLASGHIDGMIQRWNALSGEKAGEQLRGSAEITALTSWREPNGRIVLASCSDWEIQRWDAATGEKIGTPLKSRVYIAAATSWSAPDGHVTFVTGGGRIAIKQRDSTTGRIVNTSIRGWFAKTYISRLVVAIRGYFGASNRVPLNRLQADISQPHWTLSLTSWITPEGRVMLASGGDDGTIQRWDAATGSPTGKPLTGHGGAINALRVWTRPEGNVIASCGEDGTIRLWNAITGATIGKSLVGHVGEIHALTSWIGPDNHVMLASSGNDGTIRRWDATTGAVIGNPLTGHTRPIFSLAAWNSADGYPMLGSPASADAYVQRWNAWAGSPVGPPMFGLNSASRSLTSWTGPDGHSVLAAADDDGNIWLWDADSGTPIRESLLLSAGSPPVVLAVWTGEDGHMMLAAAESNGSIRCWDANRGSASRKILSRRRYFWDSAKDNGGVKLSKLNWFFGRPRPASVYVLATSPAPDGSVILVSGGLDGTIRRWDASSGTAIGKSMTGHIGAVQALTIWTTPDGPILASGGDDGTIRRWDATSGAPIGEPLIAHVGGVGALIAWADPEGNVLLASGGRDGVIRVWDTTSGEMLTRVFVEPIRLRGLADRPAARDLLGRTALTQTLANLLLWRPTEAGREPGPSVVTFEGPWGTGKTTMMRLLEARVGAKPESPILDRRLSVAGARKILRRAKAAAAPHISVTESREYRGALTAWFNPWVCQSSEQVWAGLARSVTEAARPVLYPAEADAKAQRYWLERNAPHIDRFAVRRNMLLRILSPILGLSVLIGVGTALINLAKVNNSTLFRVYHWHATLSALALAIAIILLVLGLLHTVIRYYSSASIFLPPAIIYGSVLGSSLVESAAETTKLLRDSAYVAEFGYLAIVQADTARTVRDLRGAGYDLVVFIDDLDRCSARTTAEVFESVNLFLSGTTDLEAKFVLGLDPAVIAAHLDTVYKDLDEERLLQYGDDPSAGWAFLRKVIQLPVGVPYILDSAVDQFVGAALDLPTETEGSTVAFIKARLIANEQTEALQTELKGQVAHLAHPPQPASLSRSPEVLVSPPKRSSRRGPLERQPEIVALMRERLTAQPDRSAREAKRLLNVWQLYQRVMDIVAPLRDDEEVVRRACQLVILAEIITRWPALQQQLNQPKGGQRGLQILAAACEDDNLWTIALKETGLERVQYAGAAASLRDLLRDYDGVAVASLAARVL